jgi:hypothetical protein
VHDVCSRAGSATADNDSHPRSGPSQPRDRGI